MRHDDEIDKELRFHVDTRADELIATGLPPDAARRQARLEFGGVMQTKEAVRDLGIWSIVNGLVQDLRLAVRSLRTTPIVTAVAVLSLALGIGANTAIFSLVDSLLLRPLPVREPGRLVLLRSRQGSGYPEWSYPVWHQIQQRPELFESVMAWSPVARANFFVDGVAQKADGFLASGSFFNTLGVSALVGRTFSDADDRPGGGPDGPVAVISYGFWRRQFEGDARALGRTVTLENVEFTVVGVMAPGFSGPDVGRAFDVIVPLGTEPLVSRSEGRIKAAAGASWLNVMGRLRPDQTLDTATTAIRGVRRQILDATIPTDWPSALIPEYRARPFSLVPAAAGDSVLRARYQLPLVTIMVVVALVLLIACANIANLLLARATARRHELSLRVALGASRWRLVRQLFAESGVLAGTGAALGIALASWGSRFVVRQISTEARPVFLDVAMDRRMLLFTIGVTMATALIFGVAPAVQASGVAPMEAMKRHGAPHRPVGRWGAGAAGGLVVAQIALSLVLVVAAGLFIRTFASLATRPLGFDRDRVLVASVNTHSAAIDPSQRLALYNRAREAVRVLPSVTDASVSLVTPPVETISILPVDSVSGGTPLHGMERMTAVNFVTSGWFSTFGMRVLAGRDIGDHDAAGAPRVAVANLAFARKYLHGEIPLGHRIASTVGHPPRTLSIDIVGVVEDAVFGSLRAPQHPLLYLPMAQTDWLQQWPPAQADLSVRSGGAPPLQLAKVVGTAVRGVDADLVVTFRSLADQVGATLAQERIVAVLSGFFGGLALLLAALGLYGVTSYAVSRRRKEIGIRTALGASPGAVVLLVVSRVAKLVASGAVIGAALSIWASQFVAVLLYGVEPRDPATLAGATVILMVVGAAAGLLPAYRASRVGPSEVLRES
ncbi:MAG: ADOP family duplicated permease [Vicinamibacterales bacterium]